MNADVLNLQFYHEQNVTVAPRAGPRPPNTRLAIPPLISLLIGSRGRHSTSHHCLGGGAQKTEIIFERLSGEQPVTDRRSCEAAGVFFFGLSWLPLPLMDISSLKTRQWASICYRMVLRKRLKWCLCSRSINAAGAL